MLLTLRKGSPRSLFVWQSNELSNAVRPFRNRTNINSKSTDRKLSCSRTAVFPAAKHQVWIQAGRGVAHPVRPAAVCRNPWGMSPVPMPSLRSPCPVLTQSQSTPQPVSALFGPGLCPVSVQFWSSACPVPDKSPQSLLVGGPHGRSGFVPGNRCHKFVPRTQHVCCGGKCLCLDQRRVSLVAHWLVSFSALFWVN